jgi:hypothetical protein
MKTMIVGGVAALSLMLVGLPSSGRADPPESLVGALREPVVVPAKTSAAHPFGAMAGSWVGRGTIELTNDIKESLRCRNSYTYGQSASSLALSIRCASDNYKFELTSNVVDHGGQISGTWSEATYKVSGSINGRVSGNRVTAMAKGDSFTAAIALNTNGNRQTVTITPEATYLIKVEIALNKVEPAKVVPVSTRAAR